MKNVPKIVLCLLAALSTGGWIQLQHGGQAGIAVIGISLTNTTLTTTTSTNANTVIGNISVTTNPTSSYGGTITLGGAGASNFVLTGGGTTCTLPCSLSTGTSNVPGSASPGTAYNITLTAN